MPKVNGCIASKRALTVVESRALAALAERNGRTAGSMEANGVPASACKALAALGLLRREEIDVDGVREVVWWMGDEGHRALEATARASTGERAAPRIGGLVPWFGAARKTAAVCGEATRGCDWVGVPFCGSLAEVPAIVAAGALEVVCNDAHRHLINLARVMADQALGAALFRRLRRQPFSPEVLADAQWACVKSDPGANLDPEAAFSYFVSSWAGRSGKAGTDGEHRGGLAMRWKGGGGASALRFSGACWSIRDWWAVLERCTFLSMDAMQFLAKVPDAPRNCLYCDPPWPEAGEPYKHGFGEGDHVELARVLGAFRQTRVVVRTGGDALTRRLYPVEVGWVWVSIEGRNQANVKAAEWLIRLN